MAWRQGGKIGSIYKYIKKRHHAALGYCKWIPEDGDLCLCIEHSGDCFSDYVVIRENPSCFFQRVGECTNVRGEGDFGAYNFGKPIYKVTTREMHLLIAGLTLQLPKLTDLL